MYTHNYKKYFTHNNHAKIKTQEVGGYKIIFLGGFDPLFMENFT